MRLSGMEIRYFRSIGPNSVQLNPLRKCNILVGQNNVGKSNVLKAVQKISDAYTGNPGDPQFQLEELDYFKRERGNELTARIYFELDNQIEFDSNIADRLQASKVWFDIKSDPGKGPEVFDCIFATITVFRQANMLLEALTNNHFNQQVPSEEIRNTFLKFNGAIFNNHFRSSIPRVYFIPEFRQIIAGSNYKLDGVGLIEMLARYQNPTIGRDQDRHKFDQIQEFTRRLLNLPKATLDVTRDPPQEIIVENNGLRLPIRSYGTGVHELLILVTAVLSVQNAICCIEEPEIHLHPRLQRELIDFLIWTLAI